FIFVLQTLLTTDVYSLYLHDALPILKQLTTSPRTLMKARCMKSNGRRQARVRRAINCRRRQFIRPSMAQSQFLTANRANVLWPRDRKSTRLNSSHVSISYAVFCLKKK